MSEGQVDNWVFDSLVNFLHGSIWKVPVVGFIEEKSVVFDPDSYNNMTEDKEEEFRKIHEEYKAVVDFMLSSFMEDLQVTPEQVEEACRVREHQSKSLPESHITKVALEQLWAAEDFTAFRRLMTRKNIDLQLQSLELLVAKYGVLSPALRSGDSEEPAGDDGEDDFLQVVIRYSDQLELFKCDYGADGTSSSSSCPTRDTTSPAASNDDDDCKNMKLHLSGIQFKDNVAPTPVNYQATLMSSSSNEISSPKPCSPLQDLATNENQQETCIKDEESEATTPVNFDNEERIEGLNSGPVEESESSVLQTSNESDSVSKQESLENPPSSNISPCVSPLLHTPQPETEPSLTQANANVLNDSLPESEPIQPDCIAEIADADTEKTEINEDEPESQLIQLEEAEAAMAEESKLAETGDLPPAEDEAVEATGGEPEENVPEEPKVVVSPPPKQASSPHLDEKTAAEIANAAPEQRRVLTAVRKALEINPDDNEPATSIDIPSNFENDDLQKRREYLRAQRDKLVAMKKLEREKLLLANTAGSGPQSASARPKSARAAQMAIKNPLNMRAASIGSEKSMSARRALADRLKQELIEKQ